ncbi:MAG: hypothetical protein ACI9XC_000953 [Gammaproteobacteria bacterium]|jgi:hypothetical protein
MSTFKKFTQILITATTLLAGMELESSPGDGLIITGSIVNLRAEPSMQGKILLKLSRDKEVIEISRYQEWIEVATKREDFDTGWIHKSLLDSLDGTLEELNTDVVKFNDFKPVYEDLIQNFISAKGINPFSKTEHRGGGNISMVATNDWFTFSQPEREKLLSEIFNLWRQRVEIGLSVMVEVVDNNNEQHMVMFR